MAILTLLNSDALVAMTEEDIKEIMGIDGVTSFRIFRGGDEQLVGVLTVELPDRNEAARLVMETKEWFINNGFGVETHTFEETSVPGREIGR